jgi:non-heme chloroperoxidase
MTDLNDEGKRFVSRRRVLAGSLSAAVAVTLSNSAVAENASANRLTALRTQDHGEVARYTGRHRANRVKKAILVTAVPPIMLRTPANPEGLPIEVFDRVRAGVAGDRSQYFKDLAIAFYRANLDQYWLWSMQSAAKSAYESIKAFSETDFTEDLKKIDVPTLVMHGEDDQIVPVKDSAKKSARLIKGAKEIYYPGAPHGLTATQQDQVNADLAFIKA